MELRSDAVRMAVCLVAVAGFATYSAMAWNLDTGEMTAPGPGVMPRFIGALGLVVSVACASASTRSLLEGRRQRRAVVGKRPTPETPADHKIGTHEILRLVGALTALGLLSLLTPVLGFAVAAVLAAMLLSRLCGQRTWWKVLGTGIGTAVLVSFLFVTVLSVPLPAGVLG